MNREELDAWFAQADDVLTDWHGSPDSMSTSVDAGPVSDLGALARALGIGLQRWAEGVAAAWTGVVDALGKAGLLPDAPPDDARARALWLRQHRNTGPALTVGLDGRRRGRTPSDR